VLPSVASLDNYGGPLKDAAPVSDSSTDRPAAGTNPAYGDVAGMTHTATRAWARFVPAGTGVPTLAASNAHDEVWNNGRNLGPAPTRSTTGTFLVTFPATVFDEIPATSPGASLSGIPVNLRAGWCNVEPGASTDYDARCIVQSANVLKVLIFQKGTSTLVDPSDGTTIGVFSV
jgi:hypothetical protein